MSNTKIQVAICSYGNLGKSVEKALERTHDMELEGIFTRRDPAEVARKTKYPVFSVDKVNEYWVQKSIDVFIMCGSATDLPIQVPEFAECFSTVCSFDTHVKIPEYLKAVSKKAKAGSNVSIISNDWDPRIFSNMRAYAVAILPDSENYTFWGEGVSQEYSDEIRKIEGVKDVCIIPVPGAIERVRAGKNPKLSTHTRECYIVVEKGADTKRIEEKINYLAKSNVYFMTEQGMAIVHNKLSHGGNAITVGVTEDKKHVMEYALKTDSNPEFTGSVLVAYARAAYRMKQEGMTGAFTPLHVPPIMLDPREEADVIADLL